MPWCEECDRSFNPGSLPPDGTCPQCGRFIVTADDDPFDDTPSKAPWHFYLLVAAVVLYLGWRLIQGIDWFIRWIL